MTLLVDTLHDPGSPEAGEADVARALRMAPGEEGWPEALVVLSRRDARTWEALVVGLGGVARALGASFADVTTPEDVLGDLALLAHERWIAEWLERARHGEARTPLLVFLRDRMRDQLREERRRRARRTELLRALPAEALAPSAFDAPDDALAAAELRARVVGGSRALDTLVTMRDAGHGQAEIARRTKRSPATVSRTMSALAALLATLVALALFVTWSRTSTPAATAPTASPIATAPTASPIATAPTTTPAATAPTASPIATAPTTTPVATAPEELAPVAEEPPSAPASITTTDATTSPGRVGASAELFVNAVPWCQLSVDGRPIGPTPQMHVSVRPGHHVLRCVAASGEARTATVESRAGEVTRVVLRFADP